MLQGPTLETERLILRVPEAGDFERFAEMLADEPAARHIGGVTPRAAAWRRFLQMPGAWLVQGFAMFSVIDKQSGRWLGQTGPWKPEGWPGTEVGWTFHPDAWGKGYAAGSRAGRDRFCLPGAWLGRGHPQHRSGQFCLDPPGRATWIAAMRGPGKLPEPFADARVDIWAQSREQWLARSAARA